MAGWFPGRRVDVTGLCAKLEGEGIVVHGVARRFLAEFSGLSFPDHGKGISSARSRGHGREPCLRIRLPRVAQLAFVGSLFA
ncbi:SUKH-3 domain-containing protein [Stackebrandtia soli]|uniref:SUKH-3 domain-containing protein n=1 Tax=Stackebrandtia soli TaxID=1892856 RepID=UPI0039EB09F7